MGTTAAAVEGVVVTGDGRGHLLGFPTANIEVPHGAELPADGVYAGWFERADGSRHAAAVSVGGRPTYYGLHGRRLVEAYLLDFDGDLYGEHVRVELVGWVRGQIGFGSSEALVAQIAEDVAQVRRLVSAQGPAGVGAPG